MQEQLRRMPDQQGTDCPYCRVLALSPEAWPRRIKAAIEERLRQDEMLAAEPELVGGAQQTHESPWHVDKPQQQQQQQQQAPVRRRFLPVGTMTRSGFRLHHTSKWAGRCAAGQARDPTAGLGGWHLGRPGLLRVVWAGVLMQGAGSARSYWGSVCGLRTLMLLL